MTLILRKINRDLVVRRGWQSGSDLEDRAAWVLSGAFRAEVVHLLRGTRGGPRA